MKRRTFLTLLAASLSGGCGPRSSTTFGGVTMGTGFSVAIPGNFPAARRDLLRSDIEFTLASLVRSMSTFDPGSELARFNASTSTQWTSVSPELLTVLMAASDAGDLTHGAFDVTVGPLVDLWGFGPAWRGATIPGPDELEQARARVGHHLLQIEPRSRKIRKRYSDVHIDLSSIGKGYGVDRIAALIEAYGADSFLVEIGGEFRVRGSNDSQQPWRLAIEAPVAGRREVAGVIELYGGGVATSGNYRDFFDAGGRRFSHIIDPLVGVPVDHPPMSVTVISRSAMQSDALATALLVKGPDAGYRFAAAHGIPAVFVEQSVGSGDSLFRVRSTPTAPPVLAL